MTPLLTLSSPAPDWAAGRTGTFHSRYPRASAFGRFVGEVGHRYDGHARPRVADFSLWNEPNHPEFLSPQRATGGRLIAPALLRGLLRAAGAALAATGHGHDTILIGEWLPAGTNQACGACTQKPLTFARELLCLDHHNRPFAPVEARHHKGCRGHFTPLPGTAWAVHPYVHQGNPARPPPTPDDLSPLTLGRLREVSAAAARAGRLHRDMKIWETEDGTPSNPPAKSHGVSLALQARYLNESEWLAWRTPFVVTTAHYTLRDEASSPFSTGLEFADGRPKPALAAYRLALIVTRPTRASPVARLWMHLLGPQHSVTILAPDGTRKTLPTDSRTRYINLTIRSRWHRSGRWRALLQNGTSSRSATELLGST